MTPLHPLEDWQLSAYAAGDLSPAEARQAEAHMASCARCRVLVKDYRLVGQELSDLPAPGLSRDLWPGILAQLSPPLSAVPGGHPFEDWQISASLEGDLDPKTAGALDSHFLACAVCRTRREEMRTLVAALELLPPLQPSPFLWTRIQAGLRTRPQAEVTWAQRWLPAGVGVAAALAAVLITYSRREAPSPTVAPRQAAASQAPIARPHALLTTPHGGEGPQLTASDETSGQNEPAPEVSPPGPRSTTRLAATTGLDGTAGGADAGAAAPTSDPDPALTAAIRAHLDELDATINDTQRNLALNPGNERVQSAAWAAYMAKVEYLRSILGRVPAAGRNKSSLQPAGALAALRSAA